VTPYNRTLFDLAAYFWVLQLFGIKTARLVEVDILVKNERKSGKNQRKKKSAFRSAYLLGATSEFGETNCSDLGMQRRTE